MSSPAGNKILRIGLIQNGKIIEERLLRSPSPVTVGHGINKNTFVVPVSNLPRTQTVLSVRDGRYILHFTPTMKGRVSFGERAQTFEELIASGKAKKGASGFELALPFDGRGKIEIGEITLLFQFVVAPAARPVPVFPSALKGGWFRGVEPIWAILLLLSALLQIGFVGWLVSQDWPQPLAMEFEFPNRIVRMMAEPVEPEEVELEVDETTDKDDEEVASGNDVEEPAGAPEPEPGPSEEEEVAEAGEDRAAELALEDVRRETVLGILGVEGEGGTFADILSEGINDTSIEEAFAGSTGMRVAEAGVERSGVKGRGSPDADGVGARAGIDEVGSLKGANKKVDTGKRQEQQVVARPLRIESPDEVVGGTLDQGSISQAIRRRMAAIQNCYERELRRNNTAGGRVVINFTVTRSGSRGAVSQASAIVDDVGGGVGNCVAGEIRNLRGLPVPEGGDAIVNFPFVFQPGQ